MTKLVGVPYYLKHARGISVLQVVMRYQEAELHQYHDRLDFHLSLLFFYDKELNKAGAINLVSGEVLAMVWSDETQLAFALSKVSLSLGQSWVRQLNTLIQNGTSRDVWQKTLFAKADRDLIEKFDTIRHATFIQDCMQRARDVGIPAAESADPARELDATHAEDVTGTHVTIVEDRILSR